MSCISLSSGTAHIARWLVPSILVGFIWVWGLPRDDIGAVTDAKQVSMRAGVTPETRPGRRERQRYPSLGRDSSALELGEAATAAAAEPPLSDKESEDAERQMVTAHYEKIFAAEAVSPASGPRVEAAITTHFAGAGPQSGVLESVECRHTMCKLTIRELKAAFPVFGSGPLSFGAYYYRSEESARTIAYVGMEGHPFASVDLSTLMQARSGAP